MSLLAVRQDLIFGVRTQLKRPAATAAVVATLAVGIAGTGVSFSILNGFLLRPPPVATPGELVRIYPRTAIGPGFTLSYPDYEDIRGLTDVFAGAVVEEPLPIIAGNSGGYERVWGALVSGGYFSVLGVDAAAGRVFAGEEDSVAGAAPVAILGHEWWMRRFGGRDAVGQTIVINGAPVKIVGVAPNGFHGLLLGFQPDLWLPVMSESAMRPGDTVHNRGARNLFAVGRVKPGVGLAAVNAALDLLAGRLARVYPDTNRGTRFIALSESTGRVPPMFRGGIVGGAGALMAVTGLMLLLACANVAGILLVRAASRRREVGVRLALGATRARIVRQFLTEGASLALVAGAAGLVFAWAATRMLSAVHVPIARGASVAFDFGLDARVIGFSALIMIATGVLFGLTPALEASRLDLLTVLKDGDAPSGLRRSGLRSALVLAQVTLSMVLLIGSGLFLQSLRNASRIDLGFDADGVVTTSVDRGPRASHDAASIQFWQQILDRVAALPRTQSVSLTDRLPLDLGITQGRFAPESYQAGADGSWPSIEFATIDAGYFRTMRMPLLEGRDFDARDGERTAPVVIVNDVLARQFWRDASAVGRNVLVGEGQTREIVGVVRRSKYLSVGEPPKPYIYFPLGQVGARAMTIVARGTGIPATYLREVRDAVHAIDDTVPLYDLRTMTDRVAVALAPATGGATVFGVIGLIALALTSLGLYGTIAQTVSRRTYEIGVRRALGAEDRQVVWLVVRSAARLVLIGLTGGLALGLMGSRLVRAALYGVDPIDPIVFGLAPVVLLLVSLVAAWVPAHRAVRISAATALRYE